MNLSSRELYRLERWSAEALGLGTLAEDEDGRAVLLRWLANHQFAPSSSQSAAIEFLLLTEFGRNDVHKFDSPPPAWHDALEAAAGDSVNKFIRQFEAASTTERWEGFSTLDEQTGEYPVVSARLAEVQPAISLRLPLRRDDEPLETHVQRRLFECVMSTPVERSLLIMDAHDDDVAPYCLAAGRIQCLQPDWAALCPPLLDALSVVWSDRAAERDVRAGAIEKFLRSRQADSASAELRFRPRRGVVLFMACGILLVVGVLSFFMEYLAALFFIGLAALSVYLAVTQHPAQVGQLAQARGKELEILRRGERLYEELSSPERDELNRLLVNYESALATRKYLQMCDTRADLEEFLSRWVSLSDTRGAP